MFFKNIRCLLLAFSVLACTSQAFAGPNANATVSIDLIADGGAGNQRDDGVTSGTVSGQGTKIAVEVFAKGVTTPLPAVVIKFDFDASLLKVDKVENSTFSPILDDKGATFLALSPVTLPPSGFLARAEFSTVADVTGRAFTLGIATISLQASSTSKDDVTTTDVISFNANNTNLSPDFDGNGVVGIPDFLQFVDHFGTSRGGAGYDAKYDLDSNGAIGIPDFLIFVDSFGKEVPPSGGGGSSGSPVVTNVVITSRPASGDTYRAGETIEVKVTFSGPVYVTGVPAVSLAHFANGSFTNDMRARYATGSGSAHLVFRYVVTASDTDLDGVSLAHNPIVLTAGPGSGTVRDNAGNDADRSYLPSRWVRDIAAHKVDGRLSGGGGPPIGTDFSLDRDNGYPEGITYANNRFYVVDFIDDKVYVYTMSGQRDTGADFSLDRDNGSPDGITYANNRFYVVDRSDDKVYVYTMSGQSGSTGSGGGSSGSPDLVVESPSVSDNTLTTGQSFTLSATVRNQGTGASVSTTLRYYQSSNATISTRDTEVGTDSVGGLSVSGTSAESISLSAPSSAGTYYYGACVNSVTGESDTGNNCSDAVTVTVSSGSGTPPPSGDAVTGTLTECSGARLVSNLVSVTMKGTVQAHRSVSALRITGYGNGEWVGVDLLNDMSAGQSQDFSISGSISTSASTLTCSVRWDGLVQGSKSQGVVDER